MATVVELNVTRQRQQTRVNGKAWGLFPNRWGLNGSKHAVKTVGQLGLAKPELALWAESEEAPEYAFNVFGEMHPGDVDFDLDVRLARAPSAPPSEWTEDERVLALEMCYRPWVDALLATDPNNPRGVTKKAFYGRSLLNGHGHAFFKFNSGIAANLKEAARWLHATRFKNAKVGPFLVSNDVRVIRGNREDAGERLLLMPGSHHADGDLITWMVTSSPSQAVNPQLADYAVELLVQAIYRATVVMLARAVYVEGQRHDTALKLSGLLCHEIGQGSVQDTPSPRLTEDDAWKIFEDVIQGDEEAKMRRLILTSDLAGTSHMLPGYTAFAEWTDNQNAIETLRRMLSGIDMSSIEELFEQLIFLKSKPLVVDLTRSDSGGMLLLNPYEDMAKYLLERKIADRNGKRHPVWNILSNRRNRRTFDDDICVPGYARGASVFMSPAGEVQAKRQTMEDRECINRSPGWARIPDDDVPCLEEGRALLEQMLSWFCTRAVDRTKVMQMLAFKAQYPEIKPQFALAIMGGQGIGKSFFFDVFLRHIFGRSVRTTSALELFDGNYALMPALGASILVVDEADMLSDFGLAKQLHRSSRMTVNVKYGVKGEQFLFCIPVYLTNAQAPRLNSPGDPDRTLYIMQGPTKGSCGLSFEQWRTEFIPARRQEVTTIVERIQQAPALLDAVMRILLDYPVTQAELENTEMTLGQGTEYLEADMAPEQAALFDMLQSNRIHPEYPSYRLDRPFNKQFFDDGFNAYYAKYAPRSPQIGSTVVSKHLKRILGDAAGSLNSVQRWQKGRVYWFGLRLNSLCEAFRRTTGVALTPDAGDDATGPYEPSEQEITAALTQYASKKGGVDTDPGY